MLPRSPIAICYPCMNPLTAGSFEGGSYHAANKPPRSLRRRTACFNCGCRRSAKGLLYGRHDKLHGRRKPGLNSARSMHRKIMDTCPHRSQRWSGCAAMVPHHRREGRICKCSTSGRSLNWLAPLPRAADNWQRSYSGNAHIVATTRRAAMPYCGPILTARADVIERCAGANSQVGLILPPAYVSSWRCRVWRRRRGMLPRWPAHPVSRVRLQPRRPSLNGTSSPCGSAVFTSIV
jgi:hypothetical protein